MWYFAWILGVLLACAFGIINVLWLEAQESLEQDSSVLDPLTKLPERVEFLSKLEQSIERHRLDHTTFTVILIGLDGFQEVIDSKGPRGGDERVIMVANAIQAVVRGQVDVISRYDRETFAIILNGTNGTIANIITERIRDEVIARNDSHESGSTISAALTEYSEEIEGENSTPIQSAIEHLLRKSHETLRLARGKGGNSIIAG